MICFALIMIIVEEMDIQFNCQGSAEERGVRFSS